MVTFGGNGEGWRIVYSTSSHQELYDYTIKAFDMAWKYRFPAIILGDGYQAKMRESLLMYNPEERGIELVQPEAFVGKPGLPGRDRPASHLRNAFSVEEELFDAAMSIQREYDQMASEIIEADQQQIEDAQLVIVAHGVVSRAAVAAMNRLRAKGLKVGYFRPITLRPFPEKQLQAVAASCNNFLLVESALGQLARLFKEALFNVPVKTFQTIYKPGVGITAEEIVEYIEALG